MNRLLKTLLPLLAVSAAWTQGAAACAVCTGASDSPIAPAVNASIIFLLGAIGLVASTFVAFLIYLGRRDGLPVDPSGEFSGEINAPLPQQS